MTVLTNSTVDVGHLLRADKLETALAQEAGVILWDGDRDAGRMGCGVAAIMAALDVLCHAIPCARRYTNAYFQEACSKLYFVFYLQFILIVHLKGIGHYVIKKYFG